MNSFKSVFISLLLIVSCFSFAACSASSEEIKGCSFNLLENNNEYEMPWGMTRFENGTATKNGEYSLYQIKNGEYTQAD